MVPYKGLNAVLKPSNQMLVEKYSILYVQFPLLFISICVPLTYNILI